MKKCLFFGSFSPVHIGHLNQIKGLINLGYNVDIIISPHNPQKNINDLLPFDFRMELCRISVDEYFTKEESDKIFINDIENTLPKPNYTHTTLRELTKKYGEKPIMLLGTDVINNLITWREYDEIKQYPIIKAYRPGYKIKEEFIGVYNIIDTISTYDKISSTAVRKLLKDNPIELLEKKYITKGVYKRLIDGI